MPMYIVSAHSLLFTVDNEISSIDDELWALCGQKIRRIDRYTKLSLLGALRCIEGETLPIPFNLVLATNCGTSSTSVPIFDLILNHNCQPKPFQFVNSLGNSACYFLSRSMKNSGPSMVVSRGDHSFEAGLTHVQLSTAEDPQTLVLLGGIDEAPLPVNDQLKRLHARPEQQRCYEGSHWLLLSASKSAANNIRIDAPLVSPSMDDILAELAAQESLLGVMVNDSQLVSQLPTLNIINAPDADCAPHGSYSGHNVVLAYEQLQTQPKGTSIAVLTRRVDTGKLACTRLTRE